MDGRGITIAASGNWWTGQAEKYGKTRTPSERNALQVMRPEGVDDDAVQTHFEKIANASELPIVLHGEYSANLLEKLLKIPSVIALKEDVTLDYYIDRQRHFGDRIVIFGGGTEHRFMVGTRTAQTATTAPTRPSRRRRPCSSGKWSRQVMRKAPMPG